jgi:hypothetical protein
MKKFINTNDAYGMSGPFEAESREDIANGMAELFAQWSMENGRSVEDMRSEFIDGLEEV